MGSFDSDAPFDRVAILRGLVPGQRWWCALGERESMGTTAAGEDIWRGNDLTPAPTSHTAIPVPADAGEQMSVVSESANDTIAGSGAQKVTIEYLDAAGDEQTTTVDMNGTTPVALTPSDVRFVNEFYVSQIGGGAGAVAAGHIKIHQTADAGLVYSMIALGGNFALVPHRMVPRAHEFCLLEWSGTEAQNKRCVLRIRADATPAGVRQQGVFLFRGTQYLRQTTSGQINLGSRIPALSIVKVTGWAIVVGAEASVNWCGVLISLE